MNKTRRRIRNIGLAIGIPAMLYLMTKNIGYEVRSFPHEGTATQDERVTANGDRIDGGSTLEFYITNARPADDAAIHLTRYPYSEQSLEQPTVYVGKMNGKRYITFSGVDRGRYLVEIVGGEERTVARNLNVSNDRDYIGLMEKKGGVKGIVQRFHDWVNHKKYQFANYLVRKRTGYDETQTVAQKSETEE